MNDYDEDLRVKWHCFSCGKFLGVQGAGGSFELNFGYGSGFDLIHGFNGWICDECVAQKSGRLRVSNGTAGSGYFLIENQRYVAQIAELDFISSRDFHGRKEADWTFANGEPGVYSGWRTYESITSEERSSIESFLLDRKSIDPDLVIRLLRALMESERFAHDAERLRRDAEINNLDRARQMAKRLSEDELEELRAREESRHSVGDRARLWEHVEDCEKRIDQQRDRIRELEMKLLTYEGGS